MTRGLLWSLLVAAGTAGAADMTVLHYVDRDPGDPPYVTRILVTSDHLRMDDGEDDGDFVLLDRKRGRLSNVMRATGLAMVFGPGSIPLPPEGWRTSFSVQPAAPGTQNYRLAVNGTTCSDGVLAPRAAPEAARAMAELKRVLAPTQYRVWKDSPRELQHDCDLANQVWAFDTVLEHGLPLEEREFGGRSREFQKQSTEPVRMELFRIPDGITLLDAPS